MKNNSTILKVLIVAVMITAFAAPSFAGDITWCVWRGCDAFNKSLPQIHTIGGGVKLTDTTATPAPDVEILPNINLNGETDYIWRANSKGGSGFGAGVSTTFITFPNMFMTLDAKYVTMPSNGDSLAGIGASIDLLGILAKIAPTFSYPSIVTLKIGPEFLTDINNGFAPCFGVYSTIIQASF